jgi:hypothetical protein
MSLAKWAEHYAGESPMSYHGKQSRAGRASSVAHKLSRGVNLTPEQHKAAGEAHLDAAAKHYPIAAPHNKGLRGPYHEQAMLFHLNQAKGHAEGAGALWDESKHPRDENGRFT